MLDKVINPIMHAIKFRQLLKDAEAGDPVLQNKLGTMYQDGTYVKQDYGKALYWYTQSAEQGYGPAQTNLAQMYESGEGLS